MDLALLIGLLSIAVALFFGLFFGLRGIVRGVGDRLTRIEEHTRPINEIGRAVAQMAERTRTILDLVRDLFVRGGSTVERNLTNLGKVKITAEPYAEETRYIIEIEKPVLKEGFFVKKGKETDLADKEVELFRRETYLTVSSPRRGIISLPSTDKKACTDYLTFLLRWLDSTYYESLKEVDEFEKPILSQ